MSNCRRWLLCGAVLMVITSCSSTAAPTSTVAPTTTLTVVPITTTTDASELYQIGDVGPAGGTIFITPSTPRNTRGLYFEVAPFASEVRRAWATGANQSFSVPGASGEAIGDGAANTAAIARQAGNVAESSAAVYASEYSVNGFSDWFLPSEDELNELYENRNLVGGFSTDIYWSSSEANPIAAWGQYFGNGNQGGSSKADADYVRPVRAFTASTSTAAPTSTVDSKSYRVGDAGPAGGTIFITPSTPGNMTGLYFEVAPFVSEVRRTWATGANQKLSAPGASGEAIGNGAANTAAIARQAGNVAESSAAVYASEYSVNGFSDWFLPSKSELYELYEYQNDIGGFSRDHNYWSSSEVNDSNAWLLEFNGGNYLYYTKLGINKNGEDYVRPVRSFSAAAPTSTVDSKSYRVGDVGPAGGTIFITPSTPGNMTGLYFELAPFASEVERAWAAETNQNLSVPEASGRAIGDGAANTAAIARHTKNVSSTLAAVYASEYSVNGFSDWFLPSADELNKLYTTQDRIGDHSTLYWSSSQSDRGSTWIISLHNGIEFNSVNNELYSVRPVRSFSAAALTSTVPSKSYRVGDVGPAGGTIFINPLTPGNTTGLYFEVAPFAPEVRRAWATGANQSFSVPGASGEAIGDGAANTAVIARQAGNVAESSAAVYASEYSVNGFSDWFLPSKDELNELYENRNLVGGLSAVRCWSSSEFAALYAWLQVFPNGDQYISEKDLPICVRPVRAFP